MAIGIAAGAVLLAGVMPLRQAAAQPPPIPPAEGSLVAAHEYISDRGARHQLARLLSYQPQRRAEALWHYRRLLEDTPHDPALVTETAEVLQWMGEEAAAVDLLTSLPAGTEQTRAGLLLQARVERSLGRAGRARAILEGLRPLEGRTEQLLDAAALTDSGALHGAEAVVRGLLAESPDDPGLRLQLGDLLQAQGRIYAAEHHYARLLADTPDQTLAAERLRRLPHRGPAEPADTPEPIAPQEAPAAPQTARDHLATAEQALQGGDIASAEQAVRRALELEPELTRADYLLAEVLIARNALAEAEEQLQQVATRFPDATEARLNLARLASWQGDYDRALDHYDALAAEHPTDPTFPLEAARLAGWAGEPDQARERYATLLTLLQAEPPAATSTPGPLTAAPPGPALPTPTDPAYPAAAEHRAVHQEARAKALVHDRHPRTALTVLQRAAEFQPHNLETAFDQAQIECTLGLCGAEQATYERVLDAVPNHPQAARQQALLKRQRGPRAGLHADYRNESGRDAEMETIGYGVHGSLPVATRARGHVSVDRWRYRFDPDPDEDIDEARGNRVHGTLSGVASTQLRWRTELAYTRFDDPDVKDSIEGRAEMDYHVSDRLRTRGGIAQERVLRNPKTASERINRRLAEAELDYYADRRVDLGATARTAHYSDGNRGLLLQFQPQVRVTEHPRQLTAGATFQYRDTQDEEDLYWTPQDYLAAGPFLEWHHDLARVFGCRALDHYYRVRLSAYRDSEHNTGTRLAAAYAWDAGDHLRLSADAFIERSSEWDAEGLHVNATWHFH
ncbi:tetratricopeptide repeat protein [Halorhodospira halophila]|uniref:Tetratricopeptide TPR_2 repeat protein n=1 Tax=Halorhodospira halophila (strain DSM 244 / SL1) TaxID=349124 RepID=A1WTI9_HALHL|nr:tetratricopeptide repeat protein [Halorhodospira halophila]ABM61001.1 Tetratricopeptide TPR_2 repeat protein [Halorhodospira halophila SL1]